MDLIKEAQAEGIKMENWKKEKIRGQIDRFITDSWMLLIQYGGVWVLVSGGVCHTLLEEAYKSRFSIYHGATKTYRYLRLKNKRGVFGGHDMDMYLPRPDIT